jgi:Domain of unknown function (DUF4397)
MLQLSESRTAARAAALALTVLAGISLSACNGSSGSSVPGFGTQNGFFRFVNGSPDAGAVDVYVDGQKLNTSASVAYGTITAYNQYKVGSHQITINAAGTQTALTLSGGTSQGVNGGQYVSLVLTGEVHPGSGGTALNLVPYSDTVYSTPTGGMAVNIHNASPALGATTFGYYYINTPSTTQTIGTNPVNVGSETQPQGIPSSALSATIAVGFYANSPATISIMPSQVDSAGCAANTLPCNTGNLSLYLIDGPSASTSPSAGPYPQGITATQKAGFVGIFDANGT